MTGRAAGFCAGYETAGFANPAGGRGMGRGGRGMGRGFRRGFGAGFGRGYGRGVWQNFGPSTAPVGGAVTPENERKMLEDEASFLEQQLDALKKRINEIGND